MSKCDIRIKTLDHFRKEGLISENRTIEDSKLSEFKDANKKWTKYALEQKDINLGDLFDTDIVERKTARGIPFSVHRVIPNDEAFEAIQKFNDENPNRLYKETLFDKVENDVSNILDLRTKDILLAKTTGLSNSEKVNMIIFDDNTTGLKAVDVLNNIIERVSIFNKDTNDLLGNLKLLAENTDSKVKFVEKATWNTNKVMGFDASINSIVIAKDRIEDRSLDEVASDIMHETTHATVSYLLRKNKLSNSIDARIARQKIEDLFEFYKSNSDNSKSYGFKDIHEFVAEAFSNPEFQNELKQIEMKENEYYMTKGRNLWDHFVDFMRSILGLEPKYNELMSHITTLVKDTLPEAYLRNEGYYFKEDVKLDSYKYEQQLDKLYNKLINNVESQMNKVKYSKSQSKAFAKYKTELKNLQNNLEVFEEVDKLQGVNNYIQSVEAQIKGLKKRFAKDKTGEEVDLELLIKNFQNYELLYSTIDDVIEVIRSYNREVVGKEYLFEDKLMQRLQNIQSDYDNIAEQKTYLQGKLLLKELAKPQYFPKIEAKYKDIYTKMYNSGNFKESKEDYISKKMYENKEKIDEEVLVEAKKMFKNDKFDISAFEHLMLSGMEINSGIIQLFERLLSEHRDYINTELLKVDKDISKIDEILKKSKKKEAPKEVFKNIVQTDKNGKLYLLGDVKIEYLEKSNELAVLNNELIELTSRMETEQGLEDEYKKVLNARKTLMNDLYTNKKDENGRIIKIPKGKWKNDLSKLSLAEKKALDYFREQTKINNKLTFSRSSLYNNVNGAEFFQVPRIPASDLERILSGDGTGLVKDKLQRLYKYKNDEFDYDRIEGENQENVTVAGKKVPFIYKKGNTKGELIKDIPLHYRSEIDPKDQSYDLSTVFKLEALNAISYNKKKKSEQLMMSFVDIIKQTGTVQTNNNFSKTTILNWFTKKNKDVNEPLSTKEKDLTSTTIKKLNGLLESHFYDVTVKGGIKIGNVDINKIINYLNGWTGAVGMSLNHHSGLANLTGGYAQVLMHAISNDIISMKSLKKAMKIYTNNIPETMKDLNNNYDKSFVNQLLNDFNVFGGFNVGTRNYSDNKVWKKFLQSKSLQFMQDAGEHQLQAVVAMSILDSVKGLDSNGNEIEDGKSILDLLKKDKNGDLKVDDKLTYTNYSRFAKWDEGGKVQLVDMIKYKIFNVFGNYDSNLQPEIMKSPHGRLFMMYRRFFFPMFMNRYRGIGNAWKDTEDIDLDKRFFSYANQRFEEGFYVTSIRYFKNGILPAAKKLRFDIATKEWQNLTDYERANIKKALIEQIMSALTFISAGLLGAAAADTDDDEWLWFLAWWAERMNSELMQFINPKEFQRIMRSPFASLRTVDNIIDFWGTVISPFDWDERYESGPRKDELKIIRTLQKVTPVWNRLDIQNKDKYNFLNNPMF